MLLAAAKTAEAALRELGALNDEASRAQCEVSELVIRTKRRMGELLATMERREQQEGRPSKCNTMLHISPTLADIGLDRMEASRCQRIAEVPLNTFEHYIADTIGSGKQATQAAVIRLAPVAVDRSAPTKDTFDWSALEEKLLAAVRSIMGRCPPDYLDHLKDALLALAEECTSSRKARTSGR